MKAKPLLFALAVLAQTAWLSGCETKQQAASAPPPVEFVEVAQKDVPVSKEWVSTLDGFVNAQIRAQVKGLLVKQNYTNGAFVSKDSPLFEIDPRPFQAALDQASANLEQAKANLHRAEAQLGKTELDVTRYAPLAKESAISQQELDDAVQANLGAKAQVEQAKAAIASTRAAEESAKLDLSFTKIVSPIDGIAAIATAQIGDFVSPSGEPLTAVSTINPILVNFTASEQEYLNAMKQAATLGVDEHAILNKLEWQLRLSDGSIYPHKGHFYALDRQVDVRTGAILVKVEFPNPGNVLRPGGFGNISTVVRVQKNALLVPQRAVNELQGGYLVAVIGNDNKVNIRPIKVGPRVDTMWIVDEGLKPGDRIVAEGVQKVREGMEVQPKAFQQGPGTERAKIASNTP
ncbi:MAG TPA: efflux RND transporter periplasmic adaptor subunit [Candidatus Sulfotelmatobacter sp.]|nr:efflux RND transporter periplasmic adaptor subunit [Candidatus Sulfotelmatobacter sp.]